MQKVALFDCLDIPRGKNYNIIVLRYPTVVS
jgi:hypothetical protein